MSLLYRNNLQIRAYNADERVEIESLFKAMGHDNVLTTPGCYPMTCWIYFDDLPCKEVTIEQLRKIAEPKGYFDESGHFKMTSKPLEDWRPAPAGFKLRDICPWQPIETATKDCCELVDLWVSDGSRIPDCKWDVKRQTWVQWTVGDFDNMGWYPIDYRADYWMYSPNAPIGWKG